MKTLVHQVNGLTVRTVIHLDDEMDDDEKKQRAHRIYHLTHKDAGPSRSKAWKQRNPDLARERQREYNRRWRKNNPEDYKRQYQMSNRKRAMK